jgi:hypothetical protein
LQVLTFTNKSKTSPVKAGQRKNMELTKWIVKNKKEIVMHIERHYCETPGTTKEIIPFVKMDKILFAWAKEDGVK